MTYENFLFFLIYHITFLLHLIGCLNPMIGWNWLAEISTLMWLVERRCDFSTNRTARSANRSEIALLWTIQIAGNTIDFKMNIINAHISYPKYLLSFPHKINNLLFWNSLCSLTSCILMSCWWYLHIKLTKWSIAEERELQAFDQRGYTVIFNDLSNAFKKWLGEISCHKYFKDVVLLTQLDVFLNHLWLWRFLISKERIYIIVRVIESSTWYTRRIYGHISQFI
jgi:hypothetical protein